MAYDSAGYAAGQCYAKVGGIEYSVGGWGQYEVDRRHAQWDVDSVHKHYGDRSYVYADDVVHSLMTSRAQNVVKLAARNLAEVLHSRELSAALPKKIMPITASVLTSFADDDLQWQDPIILQELYNDILPLSGGPSHQFNIIEMPSGFAQTADVEAVLALETAVVPYIESLENMQAVLAEQFDMACRMHKGGKPSGKPSGKTRGEEVDDAAKIPPLTVIKTGLSWDDASAFDIIDGKAVSVYYYDGIYYGVSERDSPSRSTLLSPSNIAAAAFDTSGRLFAWIVFDSAEACYAIRMAPIDGKVVQLNPDNIITWLKTHLIGSPPHKIKLTDYLTYLRSLGFEIHESTHRDSEVRFNILDITTATERTRTLASLRALTRKDFEDLDWTAYDRDAGSKSCSEFHETAGDVTLDLKTRTVTAPKIRPGTMWGAHTHTRSFVTFHTHPASQYHGTHAEPPSTQDIIVTLWLSSHDKLAWAFISAPEGTYIIRPSQVLIDAFRRDPDTVKDSVSHIYESNNCFGAPAICGEQAVHTLEDAGFVAYLRDVPCMTLLSIPDVDPDWNRENREASRAAYIELTNMPADTILAIDWTLVIAESEVPTLQAPSWLIAKFEDGQAMPTGFGHRFGDINSDNTYPTIRGPMFIVYFPIDSHFPVRIPQAAINAARRNANFWAWVVFLSPIRITIIRTHDDNVEIHGPVMRKLESVPRKHKGGAFNGGAFN